MRLRWINAALLAALLSYGIGNGAQMAGDRDTSPVIAASAQRSHAPADRRPDPKGKAQKIYASTCRTCHESGLLGAPRLGNREEWAARLTKGRSVLLDNTIKGYQKMPARGGRPSLTTKELSLVLDYMLQRSR